MTFPDGPRDRRRSDANRPVEPSEASPLGSPAEDVTRLGRIAGGPFAVTTGDVIPISADLLRTHNISVLRVNGDSMIGEHLLDGDHVIMEKRNTAKDGEMVVALIKEHEVALTRFHRDGNRIRLEAINPSHEVMVIDEKDVTIQGIVVGILRKYSD